MGIWAWRILSVSVLIAIGVYRELNPWIMALLCIGYIVSSLLVSRFQSPSSDQDKAD